MKTQNSPVVIELYINKDINKVEPHFKSNWFYSEETSSDDEGVEVIIEKGIHPKLAAIPVKEIKTARNEGIKVINQYGDVVFELQAEKALQLGVLDSYLRGYLKRNKKWL